MDADSFRVRRPGGAPRRSPIEIVATMGSYLTRTPAADPSQDGYRDWARARLSVVDAAERTGRVPW